MTEEEKSQLTWADVFKSIERDKARLCHPTTYRKGKAVKLDVEPVFLLGPIVARLTDRGFKFEVHGG